MVSLILRHDRAGALTPVPIQSEHGKALLADLDPEARLESWHLVDADGRRWSGGEAFEPVLRAVPRLAPLGGLVGRVPAGVRDRGYRLVARNRVPISRFVPASAKRRARARVEGTAASAC